MANKKLKLEVELDTAKAKRQKKELEAESPSTGAAVSSTSPAASHAARQIKELGDAAQGTKVNMKEVTRAFSGMAVGMAANYAAKSMKPGAARDAVEYGGAAVTGAAMGMMAGPIGSVVGALGGLLKTYLDKQGENKMMSEDFEKGEEIYSSTKKKNDRLRSLTDVDPDQYASSIAGMKDDLDNYVKSSEDFVKQIREELKKATPDKEKIADLRRNLDFNRAQIERYESAIRSMEKIQEKQKGETRTSTTGTDALAKVGGTAFRSTFKDAITGKAADESGRSPDANPNAKPSSSSGRTPVADQLAKKSSASARTSAFNFGFSVQAQRVSTMTFGGPTGGDSLDKAMKVADEWQARRDEQMQKTLEEIAKNTKGGYSWQ